MPDTNITNPTSEQIQSVKAALWAPDPDLELESVADRSKKIVAEGDSWFDYPPSFDVLDHLKSRHHYKIHKFAEAGDTIENMAFGTEIRRSFRRRTPQLEQTLAAIERHRPGALLLSGGGNDIADTLGSYLYHRGSGRATLNESYLADQLENMFIPAYEHICQKAWAIDNSILVVTHGYAYAPPDGRAVINGPFGFRFIGPWLRPELAKKGHVDRLENETVIRVLIDRFNEALAKFEERHAGHVKHLDLRADIASDDWVNELHLTNEAYARVAARFDSAINEGLA